MCARKKVEKVIDPNAPPKPKRSHSPETRALISERRRNRAVQPRNISQSLRSLSFYSELEKEYEKISKSKKLTEKDKKKVADARAWIADNKYNLGHIDNANNFRMLEEDFKKWGILTEYKEMYHQTYEDRVGTILYSDEISPINHTSNNPEDIISLKEENDLDFWSDCGENFANINQEEQLGYISFEGSGFYEMSIDDE